jgi:hypothetical protein
VGRHNLDVFDLPLAVRPFVLNTDVGEMDVAVDHGKVTARRPLRDVGGVPIGVLFLPTALTFQSVQEALVVPLQLVVENDSRDRRALVLEPLGRPFIGPIELCIVGQFPWLHEAGVVGLRCAVAIGLAMSFQQLTTALRQRHERRPVTADEVGSCLHKVSVAEGSQLAAAGLGGTAALIAKVGRYYNAKRAGSSQHSDFGLAQIDHAIPVPHWAARGTARQVQIPCQRVSRLLALGLQIVRTPGAPAAQVRPVALLVTRVEVSPHASFPKA